MADWTPNSSLAKAVEAAGFLYDPDQQIIFSRMDAMQRKFGYAYGYDALALPMYMSIDCEPIFFSYAGKEWMIELWKGQYGFETGCEVGVYRRGPADGPQVVLSTLDTLVGTRPSDPKHSLFYFCADDDERLEIATVLLKGSKPLFSRGPERHWWLTGFKWGEYSEPSQLSMNVAIAFPNKDMCDAFTNALAVLGYQPDVKIEGLKVEFTFGRPFSPQPRLDPKFAGLLQTVNDSNQAISLAYSRSATGTRNDPNLVQGDAATLVMDQLAVATNFASSSLAAAGQQIGKSVGAIQQIATDLFGLSIQDAASAIANAGYSLWDWFSGSFSSLGSLSDRACIVEIDNLHGSIDWALDSFGVTDGYGTYTTNPPSLVRRGQVVRFVLANSYGSGTEGWCKYRDVLTSESSSLVSFGYSCPLTPFYWNAASADPPFMIYAASGHAPPSWDQTGVVPRSGSPLSVSFATGGAPSHPPA